MLLSLVVSHSLAWQLVQASSISANATASPSSCDDIHDCRTLSDIVWSCLVTIFACTWLAVHPNIPGPDESPLSNTLSQVKLMLFALIAPEIILGWAIRQWYVARRVAAELQGMHSLSSLQITLRLLVYFFISRLWMDSDSWILCGHGRIHVV